MSVKIFEIILMMITLQRESMCQTIFWETKELSCILLSVSKQNSVTSRSWLLIGVVAWNHASVGMGEIRL